MQNFDQSKYWVDRHKNLVGDPRSVGNLGASVEDNHLGEQQLIELIARLASRLEAGRVLDLGCGYGRIAAPFIDNGWRYTGVDVSPDALEQARDSHPDAEFLEKDLLEWKPKQEFDLVLALYVLVHFVDDKQWAKFAQHAFNAVAPGGLMIIADHFPAERQSAPHYVARPIAEYDSLLAPAGLELDEALMGFLATQNDIASAKQFRIYRKQG